MRNTYPYILIKGVLEMAYTKEQIEWLHDNGLMPDWAYYQQNGKTAQENWNGQHRKIMERYRQRDTVDRK